MKNSYIQKIKKITMKSRKNAYNHALDFSWTYNSKMLNDIYTKIE